MAERVEVEEPPAKKKKGDKGYPPGIFGEPGKLQARLPGFKVDGKVCQKPIPKTYKDVEAALAAQAEARQKLAAGGPEAVWLIGLHQRGATSVAR